MCRRERPLSLGVALDFMSYVTSKVCVRAARGRLLRRGLSAGGFARLAAYVLAGVTDSLALVRLGRAEVANDRGHLPDLLLVVSADDDLGLRFGGDRDAGRRLVLDGV